MNELEAAAGLAATPGYQYAERVGDQLFVAGQVPRDCAGGLIGAGDPAVQAAACLDSLRTLIEVYDFAVADIRRLVIYVVGEHQNLLDTWATVTHWFDDNVPPATLLGVNQLGYSQQLVEIDATIVKRTKSQLGPLGRSRRGAGFWPPDSAHRTPSTLQPQQCVCRRSGC